MIKMTEKINSKKVTENEMAKVTGGSLTDSSSDSKFLGALTGQCDRYGTGMIYWSSAAAKEVKDAWAKLGVDVVMKKDDTNEYFINGRKVTQGEARTHAQQVTGKTLRDEEWNW